MGSITFIGTGTSTGIPEIGCNCSTCTSSDPHDHRYRASAYIQHQNKKLLIDCGPDFRSQMISAHIQELDAILITHEHYDHTGGLDDLRPLLYHDRHCPIFAESNVIEALHTRLPYVFNEHRYPGVPNLELYPISPSKELQLDQCTIEPLRVMHGKLPILGFKIGDMAYITDCKTLPEETRQKLQKIPLLIINALRLYQHPAHMALSEALELIEQLSPQQAYLTHFAHTFGTHAQIEKMCPPNVYPAYDGLTLHF